MTEDWNTTDELKKDIITAVYKDINDKTEEMVEDLGCPRSFAEGLLKSCLLYTSPSPRDS